MKTPITYYGGKQSMLPSIRPLIPPHRVYTEAFVGGAAVFFAKRPAQCEVINDLNQELVNFYVVLKTKFEELKKLVDASLHSRDLHAHARHINMFPSFFSDVQRAWSVWYCTKVGFASMIDGTFGYDFSGQSVRTLLRHKELFREHLSRRLENVTIENRDGLEVIKLYDFEDSWHFVDPPYVDTDCGHYTDMFGRRELNNLLDVLSNIKGKFLLTMFPDDDIQKFVDDNGWHIHKVERTISAAKSTDARRKQEEWMVVNYDSIYEMGGLFSLDRFGEPSEESDDEMAINAEEGDGYPADIIGMEEYQEEVSAV